MSDILISYAREDRPVAQFLADQLTRAGYNCWWDRELLSGADFEQEIAAELATARAVVVLWSVFSTKSGWVRDEAAAAMERGVLLPVRLNGADIPMGFRSLHSIPFDQDNPSELLRAIVRLTTKPPRPGALLPATKKTGLGLIESICLAFLLLAIVGFFWLRNL